MSCDINLLLVEGQYWIKIVYAWMQQFGFVFVCLGLARQNPQICFHCYIKVLFFPPLSSRLGTGLQPVLYSQGGIWLLFLELVVLFQVASHF